MKPDDIGHVKRLAAAWREHHPQHADGVVLIFRRRVYGWKNTLRDPQHERPGALAVDAAGKVFRATGGDAYRGAKHWQPTSPDNA